jgi:RNA polymerase sigma-70 factor (ECF subfamily)
LANQPDLGAELARYHADCVGWALTCCKWDRSEADDVLQTSYLKVLSGRAEFHKRSSFRTWLFGIIRLTALERRRRSLLHRFFVERSLDAVDAIDPAPDPASALARSQESARLVSALSSLPARQRDLLHLVFYQELTIREAADVLGISLGTARTHYERGKARLRELLRAGEDR